MTNEERMMKYFNADDLVDKGLVTSRYYPDLGLKIYKYARKVFYNNLWHLSPRLLECRGIVVGNEGNVVAWPFTKVFNLGENSTNLPDNKLVTAVEKKNGFLGVVSSHKGELLFSTTGSLDSPYCDLAKETIHEQCGNLDLIKKVMGNENMTFMFEICHPSDPHIVQEDHGAYLIGCRYNDSGIMLPEAALDGIAKYLGAKRPHTVREIPFSYAKELAAETRGEGYMIRKPYYPYDLQLKIKSPYYLARKAVMRGKAWKIWDDDIFKRVDEEFYGMVNFIRNNYTEDVWNCLLEQERREILDYYFHNENYMQ